MEMLYSSHLLVQEMSVPKVRKVLRVHRVLKVHRELKVLMALKVLKEPKVFRELDLTLQVHGIVEVSTT
jgi:hypothetical protein